jgi:DNA-binding transcriptional regulator YiaG
MRPTELKAWRKRNGYSQSRLAKVLEVAPLSISRWERGDRKIPSFLHLALRWVETQGGEPEVQGRKMKKERR